MKRLVFVVAMLIAASNASPAAFHPPLVSKDRPPAHLVRNAVTSRSSNPETNHLFERFVDWLKRQPH
jgi:hypothetical protein